MNLILFPHEISKSNGYGIVVAQDYKKLNVQDNDTIVWYSFEKPDYIKGINHYIERSLGFGLKKISRIIRDKPNSEISKKNLDSLPLAQSYSNIFCGDTIFYRAVRKKFPTNHLLIRFHNCFSRIKKRKELENIKLDFEFSRILNSFTKLEKEIFEDKNITPIFLCKEDKLFFESKYGKRTCELWEVSTNLSTTKSIAHRPVRRIVYLGGVEAHKKASLKKFIEDVWPYILKSFPEVRLHLFGYGTHSFHDKKKKIYGHGVYYKNDFPYKTDGLYINPDIIGGGVKIKIKTYLENNIRFITTPYGFEGYDKNYIDNTLSFCNPIEKWPEKIEEIIIKSHQNRYYHQ